MPPSFREVFGDPLPLAPDQLQSNESIQSTLVGKGKPFDLEERLIEGRLQTVYKNVPSCARDFWTLCGKAFAKRTYLVYQEERYTYGEVYQESVKVARWLQGRFQVRKGDRVGIGARNYPEFVISFWAVHLLGAVACPLNSFNDGDTLSFCIQDVSCRVVIIDGERFDRLEPYLGALQATKSNGESLHAVVVMPRMGLERPKSVDIQKWKAREGVFDWQELMAAAAADPTELSPAKVEPEDVANILFTSGTTGRPKGVVSTQRQYLSVVVVAAWGGARALLRRHRPLPTPEPPESLEQSISLLLVPLMHVTGLLSGLTSSTAAGSRVCLMPSFNVQSSVAIIEREKVTSLLGVGWMIRQIVVSKGDLSSVQSFGHGGASSAKELATEVQEKNPDSISTNGYGMTETNGPVCAAIADDYFAKPTSVGYPPFGAEVIVVDVETGVRLSTGERGELWVKIPGRAKGYWNRPAETAAAFLPDGWLRTGDVAYLDEDGCVYIVDRTKDIIVRGGENVSSGQVENAVYNHAGILDCAAVALSEPSLGERVAVVCVAKEGVEMPTEAAVIAAAAKTLPRYAVPEYVWIRREPLERNLSGKPLKNVIRAAVQERAQKEGWKAPSRESKM